MPIDPVFPGLPQALNPDVVLDTMESTIAQSLDGLKLADVKIFDIRYKPGEKCLILYQVTFRNKTNKRIKKLLSCQLLRDGERFIPPPDDLIQRCLSYANDAPGLSFIPLPELHLTGYFFPLDPYIPWLFEVLDPVVVKRELNRAWKEEETSVSEVNIGLLGYTPQTRVTLQYDIQHGTKDNGQVSRLLVGKTTVQKNPAELFHAAQTLWQAANGKLRLARPVCCLPSLRLVLQEHVQGQRLGGLAGSQSFIELTRKTAMAIATMHTLTPTISNQRSVQTEARVLNRWADVLSSVQPGLARQIISLRDRLLHSIEEYYCPSGPVHGDFHHTNVLVGGDEVILIDIDELSYGDQMADVGRFLASLRVPSLRVFGNTCGLAEAREAFLVEYAMHAPVDERRARIFEASSLLTSAGSLFRIQRPQWPEEVKILLDEAEQTLDTVANVYPTQSTKPTSRSKLQCRAESTVGNSKRKTNAMCTKYPRMLEDLHRAIVRRCHGNVIVIAPEPQGLNITIREYGLDVIELPITQSDIAFLNNELEIYQDQAIITTLRWPNRLFNTVVLSDTLHQISSSNRLAVLKKVWSIVRPGGRLIVTVPNKVSLPRDDRESQFNRRDLSHLLRSLGRPNIATDQPFHWLMMYVTKAAPLQEALDRTNQARLRTISSLCRGNVIELGCGKGHLTKAIWDRGRQVIGVDLNVKSIQRAKKLYPQIPFVRADIRDLELPEASFDTAVLSEVLEHVHEAEGNEILDKAWSLIRPGGRLVVSVPNEDSIRHPNHVRQFNAWSLKALLRRYGRPKLVEEQPYKWLVMYVNRQVS